MPNEYQSFIDDPGLITEKIEKNLSLCELTPNDRRKKYRTRYVKALVYPNPQEGKDDILRLRYLQGGLYPKLFGIKIMEELGPFEIKEKSVFTA